MYLGVILDAGVVFLRLVEFTQNGSREIIIVKCHVSIANIWETVASVTVQSDRWNQGRGSRNYVSL